MSKKEEIRKLKRTVIDLREQIKESKLRENELENIIETQLERIKTTKIFQISKGSKQPLKGNWIRVIVPDSHGSLLNKKAASAFLNDLEYLKPKEIIFIGDHLECGGFLAEHWTLGYVAQSEYTWPDDINATNIFLDEIQKRCGNIRYEYIEGNHERRIETWCITKALRCGKSAQWLLNRLSPEIVLNLKARNINYYRQSKFYDNLSVPGSIKRGKCVFTHGTSSAEDAPTKMLNKFACNLVFGHTHRIRSVTKLLVGVGDVTAQTIGHLGERQPLWKHCDPTTWCHGYGIQVIGSNDKFLHITIPINNGESLLGPLSNLIK